MLNEVATNALDNLIDQSEAFDYAKTDYRIHAIDTAFDSEYRLTFEARSLPYDDFASMRPDAPKQSVTMDMTEGALAQIYDKLGPVHYGSGSSKSLPAEFLNAFQPADRAYVLNMIIEKASRTRWLVRRYDTPEGNSQCRAILSDQYPRVWNTEMLRTLRRVFLEKGQLEQISIVRPAIMPDEIAVKIMFPDAGTGNYRLGVAICNGETGNRAMEAYPMIQRTSCNNSIVATHKSAFNGQETGIKMIHYMGRSSSAMMVQFYSHLPNILNASAGLVNRMIESESVALPDFRAVLDGLAIEHGWSRQTMEFVDEGTEGRRTIGGVVNGVTFAAQHAPDFDQLQAVEVETIGGNLLFAGEREFVRLAKQGNERKRVRA